MNHVTEVPQRDEPDAFDGHVWIQWGPWVVAHPGLPGPATHRPLAGQHSDA
jgi:hypothetical protein